MDLRAFTMLPTTNYIRPLRVEHFKSCSWTFTCLLQIHEHVTINKARQGLAVAQDIIQQIHRIFVTMCFFNIKMIHGFHHYKTATLPCTRNSTDKQHRKTNICTTIYPAKPLTPKKHLSPSFGNSNAVASNIIDSVPLP